MTQTGVVLNTYVLSSTVFESDALGVLANIVHPMGPSLAGEHIGTVRFGKEGIQRFRLVVSPKDEATSASIDLASLAGKTDVKRDKAANQTFNISFVPETSSTPAQPGYLLFHVSSGPGGYTIDLQMASKQRGGHSSPHWTSTELQPEDLYVLTLVRPGQYRVSNKTTDHKADITVLQPEEKLAATIKSNLDSPKTMKCTGAGFSPVKEKITPGQGLLFPIETPSSIRVELDESSSAKDAANHIRWEMGRE